MKNRLLLSTAFLMVLTTVRVSFAVDPCLECHEKKTPGIVLVWKTSAHFKKRVGCADCHGYDIEANHRRTSKVDAGQCGRCHEAERTSHLRSRHGRALKAGRGCTRNENATEEQKKSCLICHKEGSSIPVVNIECAMFLAQTPEMQRQGCSACHAVETSCDACHTKHGTDPEIAKDPGTCGSCHMGPDHPQVEMWETSRHGVLFRKSGAESAPTCVTCHMKDRSHDVSRGISSGTFKEASLKSEARDYMLGICSTCHTRSFAARNLDDGDRIKEQSMALVDEARLIIEGLQKDGLLKPAPSERPAHPLFGKTFVISPHMLYESLSLVESQFFRMRMFYAATSYKGVFHQNPDYAHWYGNAPLKLALSEIRSEALLLRDVDTLKKRLDNLGPAESNERGSYDEIKNKLRALNERRLKGEMTDEEYRSQKERLLNNEGL